MGAKKRILLVSNNTNLGEEIGRMLRNFHEYQYELEIDFPLEKVINTFRQSGYELALIDLADEKNCLDAMKFICKPAINIPIIVLVKSEFQYSAEVLKLGAQFVVSKSALDNKLLAQKIETAIDRKRMENDLRLKDEILQAVNYAAEIFLSQSNWKPYMVDVLARLGIASESDRVYIIQNQTNDQNEFYGNLYADWEAEGILSKPIFPFSNSSGYDESGFNRWIERLSKDQMIHGNVENLPTPEKKSLMNMGIQSLVIVPIFFNQNWWGFIGFDQCIKEKTWSLIECDALKTAARIFGAAISRQAVENELKHLATHDYLTGLPNRMLFEDRFEQAIARADRSSEKVAVISIDLDKFKIVNDSYGHPVGDDVLIETARRFGLALRSSDTCARIGGDEFGVIVESIHNKGDAMQVMEKLTKALQPPVKIGSDEISVSASMGAALYPDNGREMESLMKSADKALYIVKDRQSSYNIYTNNQISWLEE